MEEKLPKMGKSNILKLENVHSQIFDEFDIIYEYVKYYSGRFNGSSTEFHVVNTKRCE